MKATSFLSEKLGRTGLKAGALLLSVLVPAGAVAALTTSPGTGGAAIVAGPARVIDGDTLDVGVTRVRLEGIDAPELAQMCQAATGQSWPCGRRAAALLRALVEQRHVICDRTGSDKYHRTLAICRAGGININEAMVRGGLAWAFVRYSKQFVGAEAEAKSQGVGIWQGPAEAPWDYRHGEWHVAEAAAPQGCAIKGNISSRGHVYHLPWNPWYDRVRIDEAHGERWFCSEAEALAAGWRPASPH
jgi:endonuclease YncB( thermonuclease family)